MYEFLFLGKYLICVYKIRGELMEFIKVILTSLFSVLSLFIITKFMGHKQVAQLDFLDYINGITIGSIAAELATELEAPWKPLLAMVIYGIASVGLSFITRKFPKTRKYINGAPTILMNNGKFYRENIKKSKLDLNEFLMMCREQGYFDVSNIYTAIFEHNGKLTVLPVSSNRPITPNDMNLNPKQDYINLEVIMDGRIVNKNLKKIGLDSIWLEEQMKSQGYNSVEEIYLALYNKDKQVSFFAAE